MKPADLTSEDIKFMQHALHLAKEARLIAPPNPWVGCVIVKQGRIIGEGYTQPVGSKHAEVAALDSVKEASQGATLYVTLEPCVHHGRTPPCVQAIIQANIKRVVVAVEDPDERVSGKGIAALRSHGLEVTVGVCAAEAKETLEPYLYHRKTGKPYCILKSAISVDGRTAAADGSSQWISSESARVDAHLIRAQSQAIIVGAGTANADQPTLNVRLPNLSNFKQPLRIVLDAKGHLPAQGPLFDPEIARTMIITSSLCAADKIREWQQKGAEVEILPLNGDKSGIDLHVLADFLGKMGILQIMVEGGSRLHGQFIQSGSFNRIVIYVGACILGDQGLPLFRNFNPESIKKAPRLHLVASKQFDDCMRLDYSLKL